MEGGDGNLDDHTQLLLSINSALQNLDKNMETFLDEDYKKLKNDVEELKVYKVQQNAADKARKGMITGLLRHWPGLLAILTIIILGALELKKMKP